MKFGPPLPVGDAGSGNATFQHLCIDDLYSGSAGDPWDRRKNHRFLMDWFYIP